MKNFLGKIFSKGTGDVLNGVDKVLDTTITNTDKKLKAKHRNESFERYWHVYTEQQIMAVHEICELLTEEYNIQQILGHEEISPGRKKDRALPSRLTSCAMTCYTTAATQKKAGRKNQQER